MACQQHHRRSIRLKGYDYSAAGLYFITICLQNRRNLFGKIEQGKLILNDAGKMIDQQWLILPGRFTNIQLHEYIIMPNHFHGIIEIANVGAPLVGARNAAGDARNVAGDDARNVAGDANGQPQGIAPTTTGNNGPTIGNVMDAFKSITTVEYIRGVKNSGWRSFNGKLWQRNYYEHIIRNEKSLGHIANYIINNPLNWNKDGFHIE